MPWQTGNNNFSWRLRNLPHGNWPRVVFLEAWFMDPQQWHHLWPSQCKPHGPGLDLLSQHLWGWGSRNCVFTILQVLFMHIEVREPLSWSEADFTQANPLKSLLSDPNSITSWVLSRAQDISQNLQNPTSISQSSNLCNVPTQGEKLQILDITKRENIRTGNFRNRLWITMYNNEVEQLGLESHSTENN